MSNTTAPYGPLSAEEVQAALAAPFGGAAKILQRHDPNWGTGKVESDDHATRGLFRVSVAKVRTYRNSVLVAAESADEARAVVEDMFDDLLDQVFANTQAIDRMDVTKVERLDDDE